MHIILGYSNGYTARRVGATIWCRVWRHHKLLLPAVNLFEQSCHFPPNFVHNKSIETDDSGNVLHQLRMPQKHTTSSSSYSMFSSTLSRGSPASRLARLPVKLLAYTSGSSSALSSRLLRSSL